MSLDAWEGEDRGTVGPRSSMGTSHQSGSERDVEECLKAGARAQESDSDHQCSSIGSSGPASTFNSDPPHVVPCEFTISLAFPVNVGHKGKYTSLTEKYRKHSDEMDRPSTKMCRYYHIEYFLLPDDREPKKVDMVVFPAVAKVFLDSGVKTVKLWHEGDKAWVSWTQTFNVNMTKELLKKINFHKITLKLWDTQDKVSKKVRCFRLKKTGYSEDAGSYEEVRHLVLSQRSLSEQDIHVKEECTLEDAPVRPEEARRHLKSLCDFHAGDPETFSKDTKEYEKQQKAENLGSVRWSISGRPTLSLDKTSMIEKKELLESSSLTNLTNVLKKQKFQIKWKESERKRKSQKRVKTSGAEEEADLKLAGSWKQGAFCIQLAVMPLLAGWRTVVSRAREKSANVSDCFLTFKTEVPIMTEEQKRDLNPLTIKIKCVSCLPSQPVPVHELERLCTPVYCRYQFHKTPVHETEGQPHAAHISFQDINVVFLGAMQPGDLREYLGGPPMVVEVHDRDRKSEQYSQEPTLFGEDPLDSHLNLLALISPKETENNPFASQNKLWDPYGVAQVSFADLLLGCKYLNLAVPVHSCEAPPTHRGQDGRARKVMGFRVPTDGLQHHPMPKGDYLEADSLLKLRVDIAVPLQAGTEIPDPDPTGAQFGRIIFVFDCRMASLLYSLLQDITTINARALDLGSCPVKDSQQVLSAFKMRVKVRERQDLDVLTGFHLLDGKIHVLILEGLADRGLKRLWDSHQSRITKSLQGAYKVLYNSQLLFRHRLYADLETILYHVHLFKPLSLLVKQVALYIRNTAPQKAFQALSRIYSICHHSTRLREVIARDLLPTSAMVKALGQEFGLPFLQEDLTDGELLATSPPACNLENCWRQHSTLTTEIQAHEEKYLRWRNTVVLRNGGQRDDLIQKNITGAYQVSKKSPKSMVKVIRISAPASDAAYNYSIQTLNSTELAKELHREMAKEPRKRFTYSRDYLSAMVEPQDSEEEKKARKKSRQAWLTASGFQVTGLHSTDNDRHLRLPSTGSVREEWRENALFANALAPVLDQEWWSWDRRRQDFNLYTKPAPVLDLPPSPALMPLTGRFLEGEDEGAWTPAPEGGPWGSGRCHPF